MTPHSFFTLDAYNATAGALSLRVGLVWWGIAMFLAVGYFVLLFRSFRGKVGPEEGEGAIDRGPSAIGAEGR